MQMMWLTDRERGTLGVLGLLAVAGLGINMWLQRAPEVTIEPGPTPPYDRVLGGGALSGVEGPPQYAAWDAQLRRSRLVDLNTADAEELARLPEIGPSTAEKIIAYRKAHGPFLAPGEIVRVAGIGPKTFEAIKNYVTVAKE